MGRVIHRQTNRQHEEHGGHYIDCQIPEIHCPHDVNLFMCNKCTDLELKVVVQEGMPHAITRRRKLHEKKFSQDSR